MVKHPDRKAYSYMRFSSPVQARGDSIRRQIAGTKRFCDEEHIILDETLRDEGVSAFRGRHKTEGALGGFLRAVESGKVLPGSLLIIESLDRLSREKIRFSQTELLRLINSGIEIVTLVDRQRYSAEAIDSNPGLLFVALAVAMRAHDESETKSDRLAKKWAAKRTDMLAGRQVRQALPAWLTWRDSTVELVPDRVAIIREIFEKRAEGWGRRKIANELNRREISVWGRGKRKAKGGWQESYVAKILATRAVLGEFQPHRLEAGRYSKRIPVGEPIRDYYPAAVSQNLWLAAHAHDAEAQASKGRPSSTAKLSGLLCDPTGAPMHVERKGEGCDYYVTSRAFRRGDRQTHRWRIDHLESAVLMVVREIDWGRVFENPTREPELRSLRAQIAECEREQSSIKTKLKAAAERLLESDFAEMRDELKVLVSSLKTRQAEIDVRAAAVRRQVSDIDAEEHAAGNGGHELRAAAASLEDPAAFVRFRRELKTLIKRITLYPDGKVDGFDWKGIREEAAAMLHGNQGLLARQQGRVSGAIVIEFANAQRLTVFVTYRPSARTHAEPVVLAAFGVGYNVSDEAKTKRHVMAASRGRQAVAG